MNSNDFNWDALCKDLLSFGYNSPLSKGNLSTAVKEGLNNKDFIKLVVWLCGELSALYELDVHAVVEHDDLESFLFELSSLLNELECPVDSLVRGPITERFVSVESRQKLLLFLTGHIPTARLIALQRLQNLSLKQKTAEVEHIEIALKTLGSGPPPPDLTIDQLFNKFRSLVTNQLNKCAIKPRPLFIATLKDPQWLKVEELNVRLTQEYRSRIQLLLKRLDVTIHSFFWSDRIKKMEDEILAIYRPMRDRMLVFSDVHMYDLLAANTDLLNVEKTSNEKLRERTSTPLNKVLMTNRPGDRGGRPSDMRAPPPEMPPWMKERTSEYSRGGGGARYGGGSDHFSSGRSNYHANQDAYARQGSQSFQSQLMQEYGQRYDGRGGHRQFRGGRGGSGGGGYRGGYNRY